MKSQLDRSSAPPRTAWSCALYYLIMVVGSNISFVGQIRAESHTSSPPCCRMPDSFGLPGVSCCSAQSLEAHDSIDMNAAKRN